MKKNNAQDKLKKTQFKVANNYRINVGPTFIKFEFFFQAPQP